MEGDSGAAEGGASPGIVEGESLDRRDRSREEVMVLLNSDREFKLYEPMFRGMGLSAEQVDQIRRDRIHLHRAALAVADPLRELKQIRFDLDEKMKAVLTPVDYERYREFESGRSARQELSMFSAFASGKGATLSTQPEVLVQLIQDSGATFSQSFEGPFDPLPQSAIGTEAVLELILRQLSQLREGSKQLLSKARELGISSEDVRLLSEYYQNQIAFLDEQRKELSLTPEERAQRVSEGLQKRRDSQGQGR